MSAKEFIQQLFEKRRNLVEQQRSHHAEMEARAEGPTAEDEGKWEALDKEVRDIGQRIDHLVSMEETNKELEEQRSKFENLIVPNTQTQERTIEEKVRAFMRAALPDNEVWAPKAMMVSLESRDLTKGVTAAGGALVPTGFVRTLFEHLVEMAAVRRTNANVIRTSSGENLQLPKTTAHMSAAIVAEGVAIPEADPAFAQVTLGAHKYGNIVEVSRELLEDDAVDLTGFLARNAGLAIGQANGVHLVTGTGAAQPEGIANAGTVGKTGAAGQTTSVTTDDLVDLFHSVISGYRARAFWVMNDLTAAAIRKLKDSTGQFLWQPGLTQDRPDSIFGRPVITDPNVATMAANALSIAFGDFSLYYTIRDVNGIRFERSDDFRFQNDLVAFRVIFRTDAKQIINGASGAVKFYKNAAI